MIIALVLWALAAVGVVVFVARSWSLRPLTVKGRGQLLRSGVDAVVALALVRALAPPPGPGVWLWVVAAVAVGVGAAGVIVHWRTVPPDSHRWTSRWRTCSSVWLWWSCWLAGATRDPRHGGDPAAPGGPRSSSPSTQRPVKPVEPSLAGTARWKP